MGQIDGCQIHPSQVTHFTHPSVPSITHHDLLKSRQGTTPSQSSISSPSAALSKGGLSGYQLNDCPDTYRPFIKHMVNLSLPIPHMHSLILPYINRCHFGTASCPDLRMIHRIGLFPELHPPTTTYHRHHRPTHLQHHHHPWSNTDHVFLSGGLCRLGRGRRRMVKVKGVKHASRDFWVLL